MRLVAAFLALSIPLLCNAGPVKAADISGLTHQVLVLVADSIGRDAGGMVRPQDADDMIRHTFNAMDVNGDGHVTPDEFQAFSMGFDYLAQMGEKLPQFRAAKAAVFRRWDANKTGFLTFQDYRAGILGDLTRAAAKGGSSDGKLSVDELKNAEFIRELSASIQ